jgi:hypothetical protein
VTGEKRQAVAAQILRSSAPCKKKQATTVWERAAQYWPKRFVQRAEHLCNIRRPQPRLPTVNSVRAPATPPHFGRPIVAVGSTNAAQRGSSLICVRYRATAPPEKPLYICPAWRQVYLFVGVPGSNCAQVPLFPRSPPCSDIARLCETAPHRPSLQYLLPRLLRDSRPAVGQARAHAARRWPLAATVRGNEGSRITFCQVQQRKHSVGSRASDRHAPGRGGRLPAHLVRLPD